MLPTLILDSHIHLWPSHAASPLPHPWMEPPSSDAKHILAFPATIAEYRSVSKAQSTSDSSYIVVGAIYIETDRTEGPRGLPDDNIDGWATEKLAEIADVRAMIELEEEEAGSGNGTVQGMVIWGPMDRGEEVMRDYLERAKLISGERLWGKVCGVRLLLQAATEPEALQRMQTDRGSFESSLLELGRQGLAFDIGVDSRSVGVWQMEMVVEMMRKVNAAAEKGGEKRVTFVLNHLCKADMENSAEEWDKEDQAFQKWSKFMRAFAAFLNTYLKLSGAFSDMRPQDAQNIQPAQIMSHMKPWLDVIFDSFRPRRIMFGSDWPVCTVRGPGLEQSWRHRRNVVELIVERYTASENEREKIWIGTATEAYRLKNDSWLEKTNP